MKTKSVHWFLFCLSIPAGFVGAFAVDIIGTLITGKDIIKA